MVNHIQYIPLVDPKRLEITTPPPHLMMDCITNIPLVTRGTLMDEIPGSFQDRLIFRLPKSQLLPYGLDGIHRNTEIGLAALRADRPAFVP